MGRLYPRSFVLRHLQRSALQSAALTSWAVPNMLQGWPLYMALIYLCPGALCWQEGPGFCHSAWEQHQHKVWEDLCSLGSYPRANNLHSGDLEMKGVAKMSPNPTSVRIPQRCVGTSMVSPVPRCPLGGGCGTEGTVTRVGSSCDHVGVTRPQRRIPWDKCSPRDLLLLNRGQGHLQPAAGKSWDVSAPHIPPTVAVPSIPAETKPRPGATRDQALLLCDASPGFRRRDNGTLQHQCTTPARIPKARVDTIQLLVEVF